MHSLDKATEPYFGAKASTTLKTTATATDIVIPVLISIAIAIVIVIVNAIVAGTLRHTVWATLIEQNICPDCNS